MPVERISSLNYELCSPPPSSDVRTWGYKINADSKEVVEKREQEEDKEEMRGGGGLQVWGSSGYSYGLHYKLPIHYCSGAELSRSGDNPHSLGVLSLSLFSVFCPSLSPSP
ncbi:hypothetical protein BHM03_00008632 [Ensete ventricosum]|nr:hypothetical protein BHM03_00008632 [Ensete ventricosum]